MRVCGEAPKGCAVFVGSTGPKTFIISSTRTCQPDGAFVTRNVLFIVPIAYLEPIKTCQGSDRDCAKYVNVTNVPPG